MRKFQRGLYIFLSCMVVLALHCRFEVCVGGYADSELLNGLNKLYTAFSAVDYTDILAFAVVYMMLKKVGERDKKLDAWTGIFSLLFAILLVTCISFVKFNNASFLFANIFQVLLSLICIFGFWVLFYLVLQMFFALLERPVPVRQESKEQTFYEKHFWVFGFAVIFVGWMFWILMSYPGTSCNDSILQLQMFFGEKEWGAAHPPLSTAIMGIFFTLGRTLVDANFGYFLYLLFQTLVGAAIFSYSMRKLQQLGIPVKWCTVGIAFFAFTPFWGTYAQWFEKDLLYAEVATLQAIYMLEVIKEKECSARNMVLLILTSLLSALLRNNGIYAVVPALFLLAFLLKAAGRRRIVITLLATVLLYEGVTGGLYAGVFHISKPIAAEAFSVPFQQTARYICEFGDEVTEYEREVIGSVLHYEAMTNYDPVISDPIKTHYYGNDTTEYFKVWFQMFLKHPGCYVAAFINKGYGYLAPVSENIEAWIQLEYPDYIKGLGIYHPFGLTAPSAMMQIRNLSMVVPLVKYLCMPGLYTWIVLALMLLLLKRKKVGALILFVPSVVNVLVCLASPLAGAIRYELPTVAVVPMLLGWTYYVLHEADLKGLKV